jgi:glyoxylase-like metal-dependent hydrolase (beta-lactamase superfamily II)
MEIAPRIRRIGPGMTNSYLIESAGEVTIVDTGAPSYWGDLPAELGAMGRSLADVRSVVLTHGHSDHIGFAERIRRERGTPILVHELDAALARGEVPNPSKGLGPFKVAPLFAFIVFSMTHGAFRIPRIAEVSTFGDGVALVALTLRLQADGAHPYEVGLLLTAGVVPLLLLARRVGRLVDAHLAVLALHPTLLTSVEHQPT